MQIGPPVGPAFQCVVCSVNCFHAGGLPLASLRVYSCVVILRLIVKACHLTLACYYSRSLSNVLTA